ncbi:hypothetical protein K227x_31030 [Rubripirellula lacrimiformis]|uniref:Uncharacterized protein n=1 Tax=Rubripirellula lacrimiformis TaxID=1930273 RepID=A0A517NC46_9BACT|nr:hypothetical protein [Rubripirellula lacrimiformis]QDT04709.1 hypothetical protein K227x_31030 [Rubripirellula lacrimiformis]
MGYSGQTVARPRSILVIVGGTLACAGLLAGALIATPKLHHVLTMEDQPEERSWQSLVDEGLLENRHLRLVDVRLVGENPANAAQLSPSDPTDQSDQPDAADLDRQTPSQSDSVITVMPRSSDPLDVTVQVVIANNPSAIEDAFRQVEDTGTLTGRFTRRNSSQLSQQLTGLIRSIQHPMSEEAFSDNVLTKLVSGETAVDDSAVGDYPFYVFEPVETPLARTNAYQWFAVSFAAVVIGLVIGCSGGPSLLTCIFFPAPAMVSLLGYPIRYGRAGTPTRLLYLVIGGFLVSFGYDQMVVQGHIHEMHGDLLKCSLGFVALSFGTAAIFGSITNFAAGKLHRSVEPAAGQCAPSMTSKASAQSKMSFSKACSMTPSDAISTRPFIDRRFASMGKAAPSKPVAQQAGTLAKLGFSEPQLHHWKSGSVDSSSAIQIGCNRVIVAELQRVFNGKVETNPNLRLISVLEDGLMVITLSPQDDESPRKRFGSSGFFLVHESDHVQTMLANHLETTVTMAEKRQTSVVVFEDGEASQLVPLADRVIAHVQTQYGEAHLDVGPAHSGRFAFPPQPVPTLATV